MLWNRRNFLKNSLAAGAYVSAALKGLLASEVVAAELVLAAPKTLTFQQTLADLFKGATIRPSDKINIEIPKIAENGAVVPISINSTLEGIDKIYILVEKNPLPLSAEFDLSPELEAFVSARLKMAETSDVIVIAETKSGLYSAKEKVKVTIGGCGG